MEIQKHICRFCGKEYETYMKRQRICSPECTKNMSRKNAREFAYRNYKENREKLSQKAKEHYKKNREVILAQGREWRNNNKERVLEQRKIAKNRHRLFLINLKEQKGGKCSICGYDKNYACLDLHHTEKGNFRINCSTIKSSKRAMVAEEVKKCILLCRNCHTDLHNPQLRKPFPI